MLRRMFPLCALLGCLTLAACSSEATVEVPTQTQAAAETESQEETQVLETEPETEPEETHEGEKKSYLSGLWQDEDKVNRRPVAVMLNNLEKALPQTSINRAEIIYEAPVEGMITRLMGIYEDYDDLDKIGSVRSART